MALGVGAAIAGGLAAGAAGSLLGKKAKTPDYTGIINQFNQSAQRQNEIASGVRPQTTALNNQFGQNAGSLTSALKSGNRAINDQYLRDVSTASTAYGNSLSDSLKQRTMQGTQDAMRQVRENMASSGGLNRGATAAAIGQVGANAANQIAQGQAGIAQQELANRTNAYNTVFNADQDTLQRATGMDYGTLQALWNGGRTDLIDEAANLIQIEQSRNNAVAGLYGAQLSADTAASSANAANQNALIQALSSGLGQYLGYKFGKE